MNASTHRRSARRLPAARQQGSFLLEALISVLIVALAILGLMGLMARGLQDVDES
jgi:Tfp pilus assembly protein PilV